MKNTGMLLPTRSNVPSSVKKLHRESTGVAHRIRGAARAQHCRKAGEDFGFGALLTKKSGLRYRRGSAIGLEDAVGGGAPCMHDALRNALVIEVSDLLA
jgi:hypothetical protein